MNQVFTKAIAFTKLTRSLTGKFTILAISLTGILSSINSNAQTAITGIVTDYNGYWKTSASAINPVKPVNDHNLLAFTYNGIQYSTGVNDATLSSNGQTFTPGDFWALPIQSISSIVTSNTKVGVGEMYDGVHAGAGTAPGNNLSQYLSDGIKGLNIGTCVANLPANNLTFFINNIRPEFIGDGIPDIIVTQVADPSSVYDRYTMTDLLGNTVGVSRDIVFPTISPCGNWTADFWAAEQNPMTCTGGFVNTNRGIRLWAADLSEFGITISNYQSVRRFNIRLSGDSDPAFVAYNRKTIALTTILPVELKEFFGKSTSQGTELHWSTGTEKDGSYFLVEKSSDNNSFAAIDSVKATGTSDATSSYHSLDRQLNNGTSYYRLKMIDLDGSFVYSKTIALTRAGTLTQTLKAFPNPASTRISLQLPTTELATLLVYNAGGGLVQQLALKSGNSMIDLSLARYNKGSYYAVWESASNRISQTFIVK